MVRLVVFIVWTLLLDGETVGSAVASLPSFAATTAVKSDSFDSIVSRRRQATRTEGGRAVMSRQLSGLFVFCLVPLVSEQHRSTSKKH